MAGKETVFDGSLSTIVDLRTRQIERSMAELRSGDEFTIALRSALRDGADINDLSEASGLTPAEIRRRTSAPLMILSELEALAGAA